MLVMLMNQMKARGQAAVARRLKRGVTMLELSIVLVIAGVIAGAVFLAFQSNARRVSVSDNVSQITTTAAELKKKFGLTNNYGNLTTALAVQSRAIPDELRIPGTNTAQNSYGGAITAVPATLTSANDAAQLGWNNVKQTECIDVVIGVQDVARRIEVPAGTAVKPTDGQLNLATLATQCELAANTGIELFIGRN